MSQRSKLLVKLALEARQGTSAQIKNRELIEETIIAQSNANNYLDNGSETSKEDFILSESEYVPDISERGSLTSISESSAEVEPSTEELLARSTTITPSEKKKSYNRTKHKLLKTQGLPYVTRSGVAKHSKQFRPIKTCCLLECFQKISVDLQKEFFDYFYSQTNQNNQNQILKNGITISPTKKTAITKKKRNVTATYKIFGKHSRTKVRVCKSFYMQIFNVTRYKLDYIIEKSKRTVSGDIGEDRRGKAEPYNKLAQEEKQQILDHINSFPLYESHYSRRHTKKKYLHGNLNIKKLFELYVELNAEENKKKVKYDSYRKIFNSTGYKFKPPKIDTCNKCDEFDLKLRQKSIADAEKKEIQIEFDYHKNLADMAYKQKSIDKESANTDKNTRVLVFDLHQCLPTPALSSNIVFYKRLLWVYNLTVRDCSNKQTDCYMWHESIAGRGSDEIASCLYKKLLSLPELVKHVITYSDTCGGQNRNIHMTAMLMTVIKKQTNFECIDQKFLIPGHTHLECDADHARIERAKKSSEIKIMVPRDWFSFVRTVRGKIPLNVYEMVMDDFKQFSYFYKVLLIKRKKDLNNNPINWLNIKWIRVTKNFGKIYFKYDLNDDTEFRVMDFTRKTRGTDLQNFEPPNIYNDVNFLNPKKKNDLISILHLIDKDCHDFYKNLKVQKGASDNYLTDEEDDIDPHE